MGTERCVGQHSQELCFTLFQVKVSDSNYVHVKVFQGLPPEQEVSLSGFELNKSLDDKIEFI